MNRTTPRWLLRLPLIFFGVMYIISCYLGVMMLLGSEDFWAWTNYFSGPHLSPLNSGQIARLLVLLHGGPLFLWAGYEAALMLLRKRGPGEPAAQPDGGKSHWLLAAAFALSAGAAVFSLGRAGAFSSLGDWMDYQAYVQTRWRLFGTLGFFEYVNLYTWLPCLAAAAILAWNRRWIWLPALGLVAFLQLSLFLKKSMLTSLVLIGAAAGCYFFAGSAPRKPRRSGAWRHWALALCATLYLAHTALTVRLVLSSSSKAPSVAGKIARPPSRESPEGTASERAPVRFNPAAVPVVRTRSFLVYAMFAPLTRTSVPAIAYSQLFPKSLPYYHLDLGQDILGFGRMPDGNRVVNRILWPDQPGGSVAVPFHFVLYSEGGLAIALVGSLILGGFLAAVWRAVLNVPRPSVAGALVAGLVLTFAWLDAIDSLRHNAVSSYGLLWGLIPAALVYLLQRPARSRDA